MGRWSLGDGKFLQDEQIGEHLILTCFNCCLWAKWEHNRQSASTSLTFGFDIESINAPPLICFPSQKQEWVVCKLYAHGGYTAYGNQHIVVMALLIIMTICSPTHACDAKYSHFFKRYTYFSYSRIWVYFGGLILNGAHDNTHKT